MDVLSHVGYVGWLLGQSDVQLTGYAVGQCHLPGFGKDMSKVGHDFVD